MSDQTQPALFDRLADTAYVREAELAQNSKRPNAAVALPFSRATLWRKVKMGTFPKPVKLSEGITAWQVGEVRAWMAKQKKASLQTQT